MSPRFGRGTGSIAAIALSATLGVATIMSGVMNDWKLQDQQLDARQADAAVTLQTVLAKPESVQALDPVSTAGFKASVARIKDVFSSAGYSLEAVRNGDIDVPRIHYASFPHDLNEVTHTPERKALFLRFMLPYVLEANSRVMQQRQQIERLRDELMHGENIDALDADWLAAMFEEYKVEPGNFALLLRRVDIIPPSLALAQSAIESGWGTSRFAREANAAFGQWTTSKYKGIVPKGREAGKEHKIRAFDDIRESVESYMRNLNTHRAYKELRKLRAKHRQNDQRVDSVKLASGLIRYSEKGSAYVDLLRRIIAGNKLQMLDGAQLGAAIVAFRPGA